MRWEPGTTVFLFLSLLCDAVVIMELHSARLLATSKLFQIPSRKALGYQVTDGTELLPAQQSHAELCAV